MRTRVLGALGALIAVIATTAVVVTLSENRHPRHAAGVVTVDVAGLRPGEVLTTRYTAMPGNIKTRAPVLIVDVPGEGVVALLGRSTHLGCRVEWVHAAGYHPFEHRPDVAFEDPCGGSLFALNGDCVGGPCPRGLDRFSAAVTGRELRINLTDIAAGHPRQTTRG
jgi:Rieske Fe-S protein